MSNYSFFSGQINMDSTRQSLIGEIKKRVQDRILERTNADLLIKLITNADSLDEAINIAALGTTYKRTGLHFDKRLEKMGNAIRYFKKNEKLSFRTDDAKPVNKLIIGDNYQALQNLLIQYRGKIDVIYIDPPYGKDSMGVCKDELQQRHNKRQSSFHALSAACTGTAASF